MQTSQQLNKPKIFSRATSRQRLIAAIVCAAIIGFFSVFAAAGRYNFDMGRWLGYCGFKQQYGLPCITCGMTTAVLNFAQGKVLQAFYIQPAAGLLSSVMAVAAALAFVITVFGVYFNFLKRLFAEIKVRYIILALLIILASAWAVTLARALAARN